MDELNIKQNIAKNIAALRTRDRLTQAELAEKLNYSDKAISKWERAESVPDITVLKQIADMFGVSDDWLISGNEDRVPRSSAQTAKNHRFISMLSVSCAWLVVTLVFAILWIVTQSLRNIWLVLLGGIPISAILLLIFNSIWGTNRRRLNRIYISVIVWSILTIIYLSLLMLAHLNVWMIFLMGIPGQAAIIIWHLIRRK